MPRYVGGFRRFCRLCFREKYNRSRDSFRKRRGAQQSKIGAFGAGVLYCVGVFDGRLSARNRQSERRRRASAHLFRRGNKRGIYPFYSGALQVRMGGYGRLGGTDSGCGGARCVRNNSSRCGESFRGVRKDRFGERKKLYPFPCALYRGASRGHHGSQRKYGGGDRGRRKNRRDARRDRYPSHRRRADRPAARRRYPLRSPRRRGKSRRRLCQQTDAGAVEILYHVRRRQQNSHARRSIRGG